MFQTQGVEKIKTGIFYSVTFFLSGAVYEIMWKKNFTAGQGTDGNMVRAYCMLDD